MAVAGGMVVMGDKQLATNLSALPVKIRLKVLRRAALFGCKPIASAARKLVPRSQASDPGAGQKHLGQKLLAKSIGTVVRRYKTGGTYTAVVGPRKTGGKNIPATIDRRKGHGNIGHLIESGHRIVVGGTTARTSGRQAGQAAASRRTGQRGGGRVVGFVPGRAFMRLAFQQQQGPAMTRVRAEMAKGLQREAAKLAGRK